ncbi:Pectin lyase-like superfamily protein [Zea mays]|uniref:Pectin lyase-like superfamily protein n=1 Tax=Zea mays TaxID=4577 RepID=A0A1D6LRJ0_MAIZE|nr:Pectin lyase-like superfamily protein [Zea mays]
MDFVNNGEVSGVTLLNSNFFHMNMYRRKDMLIKDVTVMAPGDSPNTDGIHMGDSSGITITNTVIGVGDDCMPLACSALPRSHAPASPWTTSTSSIAAPTTRPWLYARTPRAAPRVASRILHASRPFVD